MLIDRLAASLAAAKPYATITALLGEGSDATLAAPGLIRPAIVAALHSQEPRPTLVIVSGEENAERFWRQTAAFLGQRRVLHYPERSDYPWSGTAPDLEQIGARARALHSLEKNRPVIVVASARALLRTVPPHGSHVFDPLDARGRALHRPRGARRPALAHGLRARRGRREPRPVRGARRHARRLPGRQPLAGARRAVRRRDRDAQALRALDRPDDRRLGAGRGLPLPRAQHRLARRRDTRRRPCATRRSRIRSSRTSSNCSSRASSSTASRRSFPLLYKRPGMPTEYLGPDVLTVVAEPRSLFDDAVRRREELTVLAEAARVPLDGLYLTPAELDFGARQRLTLLSIFRTGAGVDAELSARRPEVSGGEERFVGGVRSLLSTGYARRPRGTRPPCPAPHLRSARRDRRSHGGGARPRAPRPTSPSGRDYTPLAKGRRRGRRHRRARPASSSPTPRSRSSPSTTSTRAPRSAVRAARSTPRRSPSPSRPATTSCTPRTASRCSRRSCARRCSARSATTCCSSTPRATSSTCRSSRSTASPSSSARTRRRRASRVSTPPTGPSRPARRARPHARSRSTWSTSTRAAPPWTATRIARTPRGSSRWRRRSRSRRRPTSSRRSPT